MSVQQQEQHKYEIESCNFYIPYSRLMCPKHWAMVPKPLQEEVYDAWGKLNRMLKDLSKFPQEYRKRTIYAHRLAKHAAIEAVEKALEGKR